MDATTILGIAKAVIFLIFVLVSINLYLILRLKDIDPFAKWNPHAINGTLFLVFVIVGMIAAFVSSQYWYPNMILVRNPASEHGVQIDRMFRNTMLVAVFVTVLTNLLLFYYSWRYRSKEGRKALYYPHNNTLEIVWTAIPAVVLALLVFDGVATWHNIFGESDETDYLEIELYGRQFDWTIRYAGDDRELGQAGVNYIDLAKGNSIGLNVSDPNGHDDVIRTDTMHLPVGKEVRFTIRSQDVLHSATLPYHRMKMDAVPGMPTHFRLTPNKTTEQMRDEYDNPDFHFEMSCQQICGAAHYQMRRVIVVEEEEAFNKWMAQQKPFYEDQLKAVYAAVDSETEEAVETSAETIEIETESEKSEVAINN